MKFTTKMRGSIVAGLTCCVTVSTLAGPNVCTISVRQLEIPDAQPYAFTCLESANACSGLTALELNAKEQTVAVEAKCMPGNVELKFWTVPQQADLSINGWPNLNIATGASDTVRQQFIVAATSEKAGDVQGLLQRPVIRGSKPPLATIEVEVTRKQAE